ncbi:DUF1700 domain-containing protein [Labrys sp. La1]|jgi:uncharacterized membrane protein|uniref:DUF1700 domain-containing protein n=1 Tax=Labrys sp. La1 TaxID=3404917 RepID=UPI003EB8250F
MTRQDFSRQEFLDALKAGLDGLPAAEIDEVLVDYAAYFTDAQEAGRSEDSVVQMLGDPAQLARALKAESGLRQLQARPSPSTILGAIAALTGLAMLDLFVLLPVLSILLVVFLALGLVALALALGGSAIVLHSTFMWDGAPLLTHLGRALVGFGFIALAVCLSCLFLLGLNAGLRAMAAHARRYTRLLTSSPRSGAAS